MSESTEVGEIRALHGQLKSALEARDGKKAFGLCQEAMKLAMKLSPEDDPDFHMSFFCKQAGDIVNNPNNVQQALQMYNQAVQFSEKDMAKRPTSRDAKSQFATSFMALTQILVNITDNAEKLAPLIPNCKKACDIFVELYGKSHKNIMLSLRTLAVLMDRTGDKAKAIELNIESLAIFEQHPDGHSDPVAQSLVDALVRLYLMTKEPEKAVVIAKKSMTEILKSCHNNPDKGPNPALSQSICRLTQIHMSTRNWIEAEKMAKLHLVECKKLTGAEMHPLVGTGHLLLAETLIGKEDYGSEPESQLDSAMKCFSSGKTGVQPPEIAVRIQQAEDLKTHLMKRRSGDKSPRVSSPAVGKKSKPILLTPEIKKKILQDASSAKTCAQAGTLVGSAEQMYKAEEYVLAQALLLKAKSILDTQEGAHADLKSMTNTNIKVNQQSRKNQLWGALIDDGMKKMSLDDGSKEGEGEGEGKDGGDKEEEYVW